MYVPIIAPDLTAKRQARIKRLPEGETLHHLATNNALGKAKAPTPSMEKAAWQCIAAGALMLHI